MHIDETKVNPDTFAKYLLQGQYIYVTFSKDNIYMSSQSFSLPPVFRPIL